jgi:hypothetical protein
MKSQTSVEERKYDKTSRAVVRRVLDGDAIDFKKKIFRRTEKLLMPAEDALT